MKALTVPFACTELESEKEKWRLLDRHFSHLFLPLNSNGAVLKGQPR